MAPNAIEAPDGGSSGIGLDTGQVHKACEALLRHMKAEASKASANGAKNLFAVDADADAAQSPEDAEGVWVQIATKKHIVDEKRLKPTRVPLPHSLKLAAATSICLITPDPQRTFKDVVAHPLFPAALGAQIRVLGVTKLKQRYKAFEARRQLRAQYDVFLADDRIITMLPRLLGKIFYQHGKRPMPVRLQGPKPLDDKGNPFKPPKADGRLVLAPAAFAREIELALTSARIHLAPSSSTAVQVGWSTFAPDALAANVAALVDGMVHDDIIPHGWNNIRAVHLKGPSTVALPVWLAEALWVGDEDVIEDEEAAAIAKAREKKSGKRKDRALEAETALAGEPKKIKAASDHVRDDHDDDVARELAAQKDALRKAKRAGRDAAETRETEARKKSAEKRRHGAPADMEVARVTV